MISKRTTLGIGAAVLAIAAGGGAYAYAGAGEEGQVAGPEADRASAAALAHLGGGTANAVERDSEQGATWEVEVTKGGKTVDVRLDANYKVMGIDGDVEGDEGADDDNLEQEGEN